MKYKNLGNSGLYISHFSLGTMMFGSKISEQKEVQHIVDYCIDHGINFFDTANVYNEGRSEVMLGQAIKGKRDDLVISTKAYFTAGDDATKALGSSRKGLLKSVDESLARLDTDYIDLYFLHAFDIHTPLEETLSTLDQIVASEKVRYIGLSNFFGWQIAKAQGLCEHRGLEKFCVSQSHYSLVSRDIEYEILPACRDHGLDVMVWGSLASGFLTGKYTRDGKGEGRRSVISQPPIDSRYCFDVLDVVIDVAEKHKTTPANVANAWLLTREGVGSVLLGISRLVQLEDNISAIDLILDEDDLTKLNDISEPAIQYPQWTRMSDRGLMSVDLIAKHTERITANKRNHVL